MRRPPSGRPLSLVLSLTMFWLVAPVAAQSGKLRASPPRVSSIKFIGNEAIGAGRLRAALATRASSRLPWGRKYYFERAQFENDVRRLEAFYADRGYPRARVRSFDVKLNEAGDKVDITITIEEGEPIIVESVELKGFDPLPEDHFAELRDTLAIKAGLPRDRQLVVASREQGAAELRDHGYAYATVIALENRGSAPDRVTLTFTAAPGKQAYFGPITITGNRTVSERVVRRQLAFDSGQLFRQTKLTESQRRLYSLEVFQFALVEARDLAAQPDKVPIAVTVSEGKMYRVNFGVGYGSEERARVMFSIKRYNVLGGAKTVALNTKYSRLEHGARLELTAPYVFGPRYALTFAGQHWFTNEPTYERTNTGFQTGLSRSVVRLDSYSRERSRTAGTITWNNSYERYQISDVALNDPGTRDELIALGLDPVTGKGEGRVSSLAFEIRHATTIESFDVRRGWVAGGRAEYAGGWLAGDFDFNEVSADARHYWPFGNRIVLANRMRASALDPRGASLVPFYKRYFLGGSTSLRGWGRFEVSPLTDEGDPIGGLSVFEASSEVRFRLVGSLGLVGFVDAGNAWENPWDLNFNDLRWDVGPGLRYYTPIGPLRFDVGFQLNPIPGLTSDGQPETRQWRVHLSIGQAF
jgi:outer membrane protein assembly complex protein YaeT